MSARQSYITGRCFTGGSMRLAFAVALPSQLLLLVKPILAQTGRGVLVPVGAHVKVDTDSGGQSVEGTIVAWRGDTLLVQPQSRTDTELAGVNTSTGAVLWSRKDLADIKNAALDIAWNSGFGVVSRRDTMEIFDLRTGLKRWDSGSLSL